VQLGDREIQHRHPVDCHQPVALVDDMVGVAWLPLADPRAVAQVLHSLDGVRRLLGDAQTHES